MKYRMNAEDRKELLHAIGMVLAAAIVFALLVILTGCANAPPKIPQTVTVVVEKYKPLPAWATAPLSKPAPVDGTVGARAQSHDARGVVIDFANCRSQLLIRLDRGEAVTGEECGSP